MRCTFFLFLILNTFCTFSKSTNEFVLVLGCFEKGTTEYQCEIDNDEILYMDYEKQKFVYTGPTFVLPHPNETFAGLHVYRDAMKAKLVCPLILDIVKAEEKNPQEKKDPPESALYPADEVLPGVENSLTCFVNHFYPPGIKVSWTKNGSPVMEGVSLSRYFPNDDQTFHQFSTLKFTPEEGDIYSCTVEHLALDQPKTKIWNVEISHPGVGATVFCGVGLTLGLLGVAGGTFLMVKGHIKQQ